MKYSDEVRARVEALRREGRSPLEITQATGVPGSTIYRWAAEGGWRGRDLATDPPQQDLPNPDAPQDLGIRQGKTPRETVNNLLMAAAKATSEGAFTRAATISDLATRMARAAALAGKITTEEDLHLQFERGLALSYARKTGHHDIYDKARERGCTCGILPHGWTRDDHKPGEIQSMFEKRWGYLDDPDGVKPPVTPVTYPRQPGD